MEAFSIDGMDVSIYDDTKDGISRERARTIAHEAANRPIFWSDGRMCHWMYDFKCEGFWCVGLFHNNGLTEDEDEFSPLHIRVCD